jgi:hypothetical protein
MQAPNLLTQRLLQGVDYAGNLIGNLSGVFRKSRSLSEALKHMFNGIF